MKNSDMEEIKRPSFSYENSKRIVEQGIKIDRQISMIADIMHKQREKMVHEVNKAVFELAEKKNMSIYDICFHTMPVEKCVDIRNEGQDTLNSRYVMDMQVDLVPVHFELEQGPGYWKNKYYRLKEKMRELIDSKEE